MAAGPRTAPLWGQSDEYRSFTRTAGLIVQRWRRIRKLNQRSLAKMTGFCTYFIFLVENGRKGMGLKSAYKIACALNIPIDYLVPMLRIHNASKPKKRRAHRRVYPKVAEIPLRSQVVRERAAAVQKKSAAA